MSPKRTREVSKRIAENRAKSLATVAQQLLPQVRFEEPATKRSRVMPKQMQNKRVKIASAAVQPQPRDPTNERLPQELMLLILSHCDIFTATTFSLTKKAYYDVYLKDIETFSGADDLLEDAEDPEANLPKHLPLNTWCQRLDGSHNNLVQILTFWMPAHMGWNPLTGKFASSDAYEVSYWELASACDDITLARDTRHQERRDAKRDRQDDRAQRKQDRIDRIKEMRNECRKEFYRRQKYRNQRLGENNTEEYNSDDSLSDFEEPVSDSESGGGSDTEDEVGHVYF